MNILQEADKLTMGDRQRDYDHPLPNFERIATLWNAYMQCRPFIETYSGFTADDVGAMMILMKLARDVKTPKRDNLTDICGYARCMEMVRAKRGTEGYEE